MGAQEKGELKITAKEIAGSASRGSSCGTFLSLCESKTHSQSRSVSSSAIMIRLSLRSAAPGKGEVNEDCAKYGWETIRLENIH